jgi:GntR family transcriptional regulator
VDAIEVSKTLRLYLLLKERITSGSLRPGERLPGEPTLAARHQLSRVTIRRALDGLARDGLVLRQPGSGTYVRAAKEVAPALVGDFSNMLQSLVAMGKATRVKLLAFAYVTPPSTIAEALGLEAGERAQHSIRVRFMDGAPFSYLSTYVPERIGISYSEDDLANQPLLSLLERSGVVAAAADQTLSATLAGPETAAALGIEIGAPLISMVRVVRDTQGRGVEHLSALYRPDKHQLHMALTRVGTGANRHWSPAVIKPVSQLQPGTAGRRKAGQKRRSPT